MTDLNPEIWENKTLGAAANGVFLDVLEKQQIENRAAVIEGRPARIAKRENRYPGYSPEDPNSPSVEFGSTYDDGTSVVPVIPAPETGYEGTGAEKAVRVATKPVAEKTSK